MGWIIKRAVFVLLIASALCNEDEKYTFIRIYNDGQKVKYKEDSMTTVEFPGMGELRQGSNYILIEEPLGQKGEFYIIQSTLTKLVSVNVYYDMVVPGYDDAAINNVPCLLYINNDGTLDHIETEHSYLVEKFEAQYMNMNLANYFYPFGKNAVNISIGDSWTEVQDSLVFFMQEGQESMFSYKAIYTLNKIKTKKGIKLAYISESTELTCTLNMILGNEFMEIKQNGDFKTTYIFDIVAGEIVSVKSSDFIPGLIVCPIFFACNV